MAIRKGQRAWFSFMETMLFLIEHIVLKEHCDGCVNVSTHNTRKKNSSYNSPRLSGKGKRHRRRLWNFWTDFPSSRDLESWDHYWDLFMLIYTCTFSVLLVNLNRDSWFFRVGGAPSKMSITWEAQQNSYEARGSRWRIWESTEVNRSPSIKFS